MNKELLVFLTALAPISELRGAIPLGLVLFGKAELFKILFLSILGNSIIVVPVLFLLEPVSRWSRQNLPVLRKFFDWLFKRTEKKSNIIQRYEFWGLAIFVGVPLPMTGAWTGCIAASLFKIRFRNAFLAIFLGILMAACLVTVFSLLGIITYKKIF